MSVAARSLVTPGIYLFWQLKADGQDTVRPPLPGGECPCGLWSAQFYIVPKLSFSDVQCRENDKMSEKSTYVLLEFPLPDPLIVVPTLQSRVCIPQEVEQAAEGEETPGFA